MHEMDTDSLLERLKAYVTQMREEAEVTTYPQRAESLPRMIDSMNEAIAALEGRNRAA